jgi:tRNA-Thr(GGU) m(6)t(6)A37 methyltransferase TsaA
MKPKKRTRRGKMGAREQGVKRAQLRPIGVIRSSIKKRSEAPKQGSEGAPDAWLEVSPLVAQALDGLATGDDIIVVTWLHQARRDVLKVHPRSDGRRPLTGVFATRSPDRPNPVGLHPVTVREVAKNRLRIGPIEAINGTPVVDIKPVYCGRQNSYQAQPSEREAEAGTRERFEEAGASRHRGRRQTVLGNVGKG